MTKPTTKSLLFQCEMCKSPTIYRHYYNNQYTQIECLCCSHNSYKNFVLVQQKKDFLELKINNEQYKSIGKMYQSNSGYQYIRRIILEDTNGIQYRLNLGTHSGIRILCKLTDDTYRKCKVKFTITSPMSMLKNATYPFDIQSLVILEVI